MTGRRISRKSCLIKKIRGAFSVKTPYYKKECAHVLRVKFLLIKTASSVYNIVGYFFFVF